MGAVARAAPDAIKALIAPDGSSYRVTLYVTAADGTHAPRTVTIDAALPTSASDAHTLTPAYAGNFQNFAGGKAALWPSLLEKAWAAMHRGGYAFLGRGGQSQVALEALTGVDSHNEGDLLGKPPKALLARVQELLAGGAALTCGTLSGLPLAGQRGFVGPGPGPGAFKATLPDPKGDPAQIVPSTLTIHDVKGKARPVHDDGATKLRGPGLAAGSVAYRGGAVELTWDRSAGPDAAGDLSADYEWTGLIAPDLHLYGDHEYIVEGVEGDGLRLGNPWGIEQPKLVPAARMKDLFDELGWNPVIRRRR
jgi:hypothetical protein